MARRSDKRRKRLYRWLFVIVLAAIIVNIRLVEDIGFDRKPADRFTVIAVIDGDTIELVGGDRLRLLSIDTPEEGEPFYEEATQFLARASVGKQVRIEFANARRDRYGRLLGYLYIDTMFVNEAILGRGLGNLYLFQDTDLGRPETGRLLAAQHRAMAAGVGIWSVPREPEDHYIAKDNSFRFHRPGCASVSNLEPGHYRVLATREQAMYGGLSPCRNCRP